MKGAFLTGIAASRACLAARHIFNCNHGAVRWLTMLQGDLAPTDWTWQMAKKKKKEKRKKERKKLAA